MIAGLPDIPRWLEAHDLAADPLHWRRELGAGFAIGHDTHQLICVIGDPDPALLAALATEHPRATLLLPAPLAVRPIIRAILHTLPDPDTLPDYEGAVLLPADADLSHLEPALRDELSRASSPIVTAYVDGVPASFAYASAHSTTLFDCSVDTVPGYRQLGLATITASTMIRTERALGREPVWGADETNLASLRLAARLGFVAVDELWVAPPV